jgi:23S rRNA A1618 N6-methylase RlmF
MFLVFSSMILGFIVSRERKLPNPKKIEAIMNMMTPTTPHDMQVFIGMVQFYHCFIKKNSLIMALITKLMQKKKSFVWTTKS